MLHKNQELDLLSSQFLKEAGLIKVPEKLVSDISNYIIAVYSNYLINKLSNFLSAATERTKLTSDFADSLRKWDKGLELIRDAVQIRNKKLLDKIEDIWLNQNGFPAIPRIDLTEDESLGLQGIVSPRSSGISFSLSDNENGTYLCDIKIDMPNPNSETNRFHYKNSKFDLPLEQVFDWLQEIEGALDSGINLFREALYNFNVFSESYLKNLIMTRALFLKQIQSSGSNADISGRTFAVPLKDIPYFRQLSDPIKRLDHITLLAKFVPNKESAKLIQGPEAWQGLWSETKMTSFSGFIGFVYIMMDISEEFDDVKSWGQNIIPKIKEKLDNIKDTVRHETQHLIQSFIEQTSSSENIHKVKKKLRDSRYDTSGHLLGPNGKPIEDDKLQQEHSLRDIEFHTNLTDSIAEFNRYKTRLPIPLHKLFARAWVKNIPFISFRNMVDEYFIKLNLKISPSTRPPGINDVFNILYQPNFFSDLQKEEKKQETLLDVSRLIGEPISKKDLRSPSYYQNKYRKAVSEFFKATGLL